MNGICPRCGPTSTRRVMPLLDGTPVLMCLSCHRIDTATKWESRSAAGLDRGSAEDQGCHADVLLSIAAGGES